MILGRHQPGARNLTRVGIRTTRPPRLPGGALPGWLRALSRLFGGAASGLGDAAPVARVEKLSAATARAQFTRFLPAPATPAQPASRFGRTLRVRDRAAAHVPDTHAAAPGPPPPKTMRTRCMDGSSAKLITMEQVPTAPSRRAIRRPARQRSFSALPIQAEQLAVRRRTRTSPAPRLEPAGRASGGASGSFGVLDQAAHHDLSSGPPRRGEEQHGSLNEAGHNNASA